MDAELPLARDAREISPGAVHVPDWLSLDRQRELVAACRGWAAGPVPMRATRLPGGQQMSARTVCLGWHWQPYRYTRTADGTAIAAFPDWLGELGREAVLAAYNDPAAATTYHPDTALINFYDAGARMGMHRDRDEQSADPVVSLSLGAACVFRFGNAEGRGRPYTDVELRSGDLFVFGGQSRFAYHGVPRIRPGTARPDLGLVGRLNITMRVTGLG